MQTQNIRKQRARGLLERRSTTLQAGWGQPLTGMSISKLATCSVGGADLWDFTHFMKRSSSDFPLGRHQGQINHCVPHFSCPRSKILN